VVIQMKKKIAILVSALALVFALPVLAWAAPSPTVLSTTSNGVSVEAKAGSGTIDSVPASSTNASNTTLNSGESVAASFEVKGNATSVTLTFSVGTQYAGYGYRVFAQHDDGTSEIVGSGTVPSDGVIVVQSSKLSIYTVALSAPAGGTTTTASTGTTGTGTDTSSTSPVSGIDDTPVALITFGLLVAAGACALALRKRVAE